MASSICYSKAIYLGILSTYKDGAWARLPKATAKIKKIGSKVCDPVHCQKIQRVGDF